MTNFKKTIALSFVCIASLNAAQVELGTIDVEEKVDTEVIKDVHGEEIKSADLGEALSKASSSVALVRRSGIANDIIIRGQKKDNISISIDGARVCGACPNRMDAPISHIVTNNVDHIEINEGPYNVEDFGVLSADVKVHTIKPSKEFSGEVGVNTGSWGYKKAYFNASGGTDDVRVFVSASTESGGQYEDGEGHDFAEQQDVYVAKNPKLKGMAYLPKKRDMDAFTKTTYAGKLFWNITDNQELRLSYTANRSDDILYPNTPMDADYDDSDIYTLKYTIKDLGAYSKELVFNLFQTDVDHPMSNQNRISILKPMPNGMPTGVITHHLTTRVQGAKIKNSFDIKNHDITVGADYSLRNWDGTYLRNSKAFPSVNSPAYHSIWDVDTTNIALFFKDKIKLDKLQIDIGFRYDDTVISTQRDGYADRDYDAFGGSVFATYHSSDMTKFFVGVGHSSRVPDGKELYFHTKGVDGQMVGSPDLDMVQNTEFDVGVEHQFDSGKVKAKAFYSDLTDFIVYNASTSIVANKYENVDATIWGFEFSGTYMATDSLYFDYSVAYQRGEKDAPLRGQSGTNLPEIPPVKMNLALNYDYDETLSMKVDVVAAGEWSDFDEENGEQALEAYTVLNLKVTKVFAEAFELTVGVDNVLDETYALSNTYKDLTLITGGGDEVMLMNEPGRYIYANLKYTF